LTTPTKAVADGLILAVRGKRACEAEKFSNWKLSKITAWLTSNKIRFNKGKTKVMLISSRKRKETKEIKVY